jgi:TP901 family phage tail tape measure protein
MAVKKAEVIYIGDAASIVRAAQEANAAGKSAADGITSSNAAISDSYGELEAAAGRATEAAKASAAVLGGSMDQQAAAATAAADEIETAQERIAAAADEAGKAARSAAVNTATSMDELDAAYVAGADSARAWADEVESAAAQAGAAARDAATVLGATMSEQDAAYAESADAARASVEGKIAALRAQADEEKAVADNAVAQAEKESAAHDASMSKLSSSLKTFGGTMTKYITVPVIAAVAAGTDFAIKYEKQIELIHTQAGASTAEMEHMKTAVLELAPSTQQGPVKLAEALFQLVSVGEHGATAMGNLKAASMGAAMGNADLEQTTSALAAATTAYNLKAGSAKTTMATLDATVGVGKMRMEELVESLGSGILNASSAAGVSLRSLGAAVAVMTDRGTPATRTMTYLRQAIYYLANESTKPAIESLEKIGLTSKQVSETLSSPDGLSNVVKLLSEHLQGLDKGERIEVLKNLGGGARSATGLIAMVDALGNQTSNVEEKYNKIGELSKTFGARVADQEKTLSGELSKAWSSIQTALVQVGQVVAPVLAEIAGYVAKGAEAFAHIPGPVKDAAIAFALVAAAIGPVLVVVGTLITAFAALSVPVLAIGAGLVALGAAAVLVATNWNSMSTPIKAVIASITAAVAVFAAVRVAMMAWDAIQTVTIAGMYALDAALDINPVVLIAAAVAALVAGLVILEEKTHFVQTAFDELKEHWQLVVSVILGPLGAALVLVITHFGEIESAVSTAANAVASFASQLASALVKGLVSAADAVVNFAKTMYEAGKAVIEGLVKGIESGADKAKHAVEGLMGGVVGTAKEIIGAFSPSRVFEELGRNTGEGYVQGLLSHKAQVEDGLTAAILDPIDAAIGALKSKLVTMEDVKKQTTESRERSALERTVTEARDKAILNVEKASITSGAAPVSSASTTTASANYSAASGLDPAVLRWARLAEEAGRKYGVSPALLLADIQAESGGNPLARSSAGAQGLTQFIPGTAAEYGVKYGAGAAETQSQVFGQAAYLKSLGANSNARLALEKYNGAPGSAESTSYASEVMSLMKGVKFSGATSAASATTRATSQAQVAATREILKLEKEAAVIAKEKLGMTVAAEGKTGDSQREQNKVRTNELDKQALTIKEKLKELKSGDKSYEVDEKEADAVKKATDALKAFNDKAKEAKEVAKIDIQIEHLEKLKQYEEAITGLQSKMRELAATAATAWAALEKKEIEKRRSGQLEALEKGAGGELTAEKETGEAESNKATEKSNAEALEKAKKKLTEAKYNENPEELKEAKRAVEQAEEAVTQFARSQDEKRREKKIEEEKKAISEGEKNELTALEKSTKSYEEKLANELLALTNQLSRAEVDYTNYAKKVNEILAKYGVGTAYTPEPKLESSLSAPPAGSSGASSVPEVVGQKAQPTSHASGGMVYPGVGYEVGETGPETVQFGAPGQMYPAGVNAPGSSGAHYEGDHIMAKVEMNGPVIMGSRRDADRHAHTLAHRMNYGGHS